MLYRLAANAEKYYQPISFSAKHPEGPKPEPEPAGQWRVWSADRWLSTSHAPLPIVALGYWDILRLSAGLPGTLFWASGVRHASEESFLPLKTSRLQWVSTPNSVAQKFQQFSTVQVVTRAYLILHSGLISHLSLLPLSPPPLLFICFHSSRQFCFLTEAFPVCSSQQYPSLSSAVLYPCCIQWSAYPVTFPLIAFHWHNLMLYAQWQEPHPIFLDTPKY